MAVRHHSLDPGGGGAEGSIHLNIAAGLSTCCSIGVVSHHSAEPGSGSSGGTKLGDTSDAGNPGPDSVGPEASGPQATVSRATNEGSHSRNRPSPAARIQPAASAHFAKAGGSATRSSNGTVSHHSFEPGSGPDAPQAASISAAPTRPPTNPVKPIRIAESPLVAAITKSDPAVARRPRQPAASCITPDPRAAHSQPVSRHSSRRWLPIRTSHCCRSRRGRLPGEDG